MSDSDVQPASDGVVGPANFAHASPVTPATPNTALARRYSASIPAHAVRSREAFLAELPELLLAHPGRAAAYEDGERIGLGTTRQQLFWQLVQDGRDPARFYVFPIAAVESEEAEVLFEP